MKITQCRVNHMENPIGYQYRHLTFSWIADGCKEVLSTDESWQVRRSNITFSGIYDGEWQDDTLPQGEVEACAPDFVPAVTCSGKGTTAWGDATTIMPWNMYLYTGDITILQEHFESMCGWVDYITKVDGTDHGWRRQFHYGDWLALDCPYEGDSQVRGGTDEASIKYRLYLM